MALSRPNVLISSEALESVLVSKTYFTRMVTLEKDGDVTPATTSSYIYRPGYVIGKITASSKYSIYDTANVDGTEVAAGVCLSYVNLLADGDAARADAAALMLIFGVVNLSALKEEDLNALDSDGQTDLGKGGGGEGLIWFV